MQSQHISEDLTRLRNVFVLFFNTKSSMKRHSDASLLLTWEVYNEDMLNLGTLERTLSPFRALLFLSTFRKASP